MTITFRNNTGPYTGKGSPLTAGEVDGNFYDLVGRVINLEAGGDFGLDSISFTGSTITFHWSDGTSSGPFVLPVATFTPVGIWQNSQQLFVNNTFSVAGQGTYLVLRDHMTPPAPAAFDPNATQSGQPLYLQIGEAPDYAQILYFMGTFHPGTLYDVDDSFIDATYGFFRVAVQHISAGTFDPLATSGGLPLYTHIAGPPFSPVSSVTTDTYTVSTADRGKYLRFDQGSVVTFPVLSTMPINSEVTFEQVGDEEILFVPDAELVVTVLAQREGFGSYTPYKGAVVTAKYVAANTWKLIGPHGDQISD